MPLNLVARSARTSDRPTARVPTGDEPRGKSITASSLKNSMIASRSWRLKASRNALSVSGVTAGSLGIRSSLTGGVDRRRIRFQDHRERRDGLGEGAQKGREGPPVLRVAGIRRP